MTGLSCSKTSMHFLKYDIHSITNQLFGLDTVSTIFDYSDSGIYYLKDENCGCKRRINPREDRYCKRLKYKDPNRRRMHVTVSEGYAHECYC